MGYWKSHRTRRRNVYWLPLGVIVIFLIFISINGIGICADGAAENATVQPPQENADPVVLQPVVYENANQQGPPLVVLPGHFKATNNTFNQKFTPNNIADFAELELTNANFKVLEREHLGPLLQEIELAVNMGDHAGLQRFRKGKFLSTRWFVQFDILKAEPTAEAGTGFDGKALGDLVSALAGDKKSGRVAGSLISSVGGSENAQVWLIGMRYKLIDASTSEVVKTNYLENKMEVCGSDAKFLGLSQAQKKGITIDSMVQHLVQKCVAEIDTMKGTSSAATAQTSPQPAQQSVAVASVDQPEEKPKREGGKNSNAKSREKKETSLQESKSDKENDLSAQTPQPFEIAADRTITEILLQINQQQSFQENPPSTTESREAYEKKHLTLVVNIVTNEDSKQESTFNKRIYEVIEKRHHTKFSQLSIRDRTAENINQASYIVTGLVKRMPETDSNNVLCLYLAAVETMTGQVKAASRTMFYP